jgi:hypothetical protein
MNRYFAAPTDPSANTALGTGALQSNTAGVVNTAIGSGALQSNTNRSRLWNRVLASNLNAGCRFGP